MCYCSHMHEKWLNIDWTKSNGQIAREIGVSASTVSRHRSRNKISPSTHTRNPTPKLYKFSSATKPIRDLDHEFSSWTRADGRPKANASYRKAIFETYGLACMSCGYHRPPVPNHIHHIVPLSKGGKNTIRNGIVLCSRCHDEVHAGILDLSERSFDATRPTTNS